MTESKVGDDYWVAMRDYVYDYRCEVCCHEWHEYYFWGPISKIVDYFGCIKCGSREFSCKRRALIDKKSLEFRTQKKRYEVECACPAQDEVWVIVKLADDDSLLVFQRPSDPVWVPNIHGNGAIFASKERAVGWIEKLGMQGEAFEMRISMKKNSEEFCKHLRDQRNDASMEGVGMDIAHTAKAAGSS